jgi:hypothetical protein
MSRRACRSVFWLVLDEWDRTHARRGKHERARAILIARSCGVRLVRLAGAFGITPERVRQIAWRTGWQVRAVAKRLRVQWPATFSASHWAWRG